MKRLSSKILVFCKNCGHLASDHDPYTYMDENSYSDEGDPFICIAFPHCYCTEFIRAESDTYHEK